MNDPKKLSSNSLKFYLGANQYSQGKYNFTSDFEYHFSLEPNLLVNIVPNNSMKIYPFEKIYYLQNGKKCYIVPKSENQDCNLKSSQQPKLVELVEVGN